MVNALQRFGGAFLDGVAPEICLFCQQRTEQKFAICEYCFGALTPNDQGCPHCALPYCGGQLCPTCLKSSRALPKIYAPYVYDELMAFFIAQWKYRRVRRLSTTAAKMMLSEPITFQKDDLLLATPLHWRRHFSRGFNQSDDLAAALHRHIPALRGRSKPPARLRRARATPTQASASRRERMRNLRQAFAPSGDLKGRSVTVIDDVCTTGATAIAVSDCLKSAGAAHVRLWCIARTPAP